jgi:polyferredoxin
MCVQTCPAGIDIRDGMQLECIACTQCIDACDSVMTKLGRPMGLVRYTSQASLEDAPVRGPRKRVRARLVVYPAMLAVLLGVATFLLATRESAAVSVLRTQGTPYVLREAGTDREIVESPRVASRRAALRSLRLQWPAVAEIPD